MTCNQGLSLARHAPMAVPKEPPPNTTTFWRPALTSIACSLVLHILLHLISWFQELLIRDLSSGGYTTTDGPVAVPLVVPLLLPPGNGTAMLEAVVVVAAVGGLARVPPDASGGVDAAAAADKASCTRF